MNFESWQWALAVIGALLVGVSKTGVAGIGVLFVVIFAYLFPAKQATGLVLPLLICGDLVAVASYRQHASWRHLRRLFPWTAAGVVIGFFALGRIDDHQAKGLVGGIVLGLLALHGWRRRPDWLARRVVPENGSAGHDRNDEASVIEIGAANGGGVTRDEGGVWFAPLVGVLAGFTTLVANAAGPLMAIYLLAMRLPKMEFVGTAAVFFLLLNLFKVPFMVKLGLINPGSLTLNLFLAPAVLTGAWLGRKLLLKLNQRVFETLALVLSAVAGVRLLW